MKKPMIIMLAVLGLLFGGIAAYKTFGYFMMMKFFASQGNPIVTVSANIVKSSNWQPQLKAVGNVRAINGVDVTTALPGLVQAIYFKPGSTVAKGQVLVKLDADAEIAQLHSLEAKALLARKTYIRDRAQYRAQAISKAALETSEANWKSMNAQVREQQAIVLKKKISAPFAGQLGISRINLGQYLNPGESIVSLQNLDSLYVDFSLPQQMLNQLAVGEPVLITVDGLSNKRFHGKISTINPALDKRTRNVEVEAIISNKQSLLRPGMFVAVTINVGKPNKVFSLPQAAITFSSYGDVVFILHKEFNQKSKQDELIAKQTFVVLGERRGDQVVITKGIKEGDQVVTSGQFKLKNGSRVAINNAVQPSDSLTPTIPNDHQE